MIVPGHYCANLHAGLQLSLARDGKILVSPCVLNPVSYTIDNSDVFNHPKLVEFRNNNKNSQQLLGKCSECEELACTGRRGRNRSSSNILYIKDKLLYDQLGPKMITFKLDYVCNLACVTCGPSLSTKWRNIKNIKDLSISPSEDNLRKIIRNIDLNQLETVHILGGEPLITKTHETILEELLPYAKNITVWYDTNATIYPSNQTLELWEKFKLIRLKFSIDGIGKSFNYLRWPADWSQVEENILKMKENLPVNHMLSIRPAMGFLNLHIIKDIRDWYEKHLLTNRLGDKTEFEYTPVYGMYNAGNMTPKMFDDLYNIYPKNDPIFDITAPLTNDSKIIEIIKQTLDGLDQKRKLSWRTSLPHLVQYL